jgi:hypothetical protein
MRKNPRKRQHRYKFRHGDMIICGDNAGFPVGRVGILMDRDEWFGSPTWQIQWHRPCQPNCSEMGNSRRSTELEANLFNLRRRFRFFNSEGEYYENK